MTIYYHIDKNTLTILSGPHAVDSTAIKKLTSCGNPELLNLSDYDLVQAVYSPLGENQRHASTPVVTADAVTFLAEAIPIEELEAMAAARRAEQSISRHQAKIVLLRHGLLDTVETIIANGSAEMKLAWKEAPQFRRNSPTLKAMADALNLDDIVVDALFEEALAVDV